MTVTAPSWWQFVLLVLAACRVYRLLARDTITEPLRAAVSMPDDEAVTLSGPRPVFERPIRSYEAALEEGAAFGDYHAGDGPKPLIVGDVDEGEQPKTLRVYVATLIRCPWCLGAYLSVGFYILWAWQPMWTLAVSTPLALSAVLALIEKNLDK